jgi:hypothetical protein
MRRGKKSERRPAGENEGARHGKGGRRAGSKWASSPRLTGSCRDLRDNRAPLDIGDRRSTAGKLTHRRQGLELRRISKQGEGSTAAGRAASHPCHWRCHGLRGCKAAQDCNARAQTCHVGPSACGRAGGRLQLAVRIPHQRRSTQTHAICTAAGRGPRRSAARPAAHRRIRVPDPLLLC